MRLFLLILLLTIGIQSWAKADDISDFEIEGFSVGDSLLDYYTEKQILNAVLPSGYKDKKYTYTVFVDDKYTQYEQVEIDYLTNDENYIIESINGTIFYSDMKKCYAEMKKIEKIFSELLEIKGEEYDYSHQADLSGNSKVRSIEYPIPTGLITINCYDYSEEFTKNERAFDNLNVGVWSNKYLEYLQTNPYQ